jgi:hypothetical protein
MSVSFLINSDFIEGMANLIVTKVALKDVASG